MTYNKKTRLKIICFLIRSGQKLESELGGWIFHEKVDFGRPTPCLEVSDSAHPETIKEWLS